MWPDRRSQAMKSHLAAGALAFPIEAHLASAKWKHLPETDRWALVQHIRSLRK